MKFQIANVAEVKDVINAIQDMFGTAQVPNVFPLVMVNG